MARDYFNIKFVGSARELKEKFGFIKDWTKSRSNYRYYCKKVGRFGGQLIVTTPRNHIIYIQKTSNNDAGCRASCGRVGVIKQMEAMGYIADS